MIQKRDELKCVAEVARPACFVTVG